MYNKDNVFGKREEWATSNTHRLNIIKKNLESYNVFVLKNPCPIPITSTSFNTFQSYFESSKFLIVSHSFDMSSFLQFMNIY